MRKLIFAIVLLSFFAVSAAENDKSLIIVTTDLIKERSAKLADFIKEKGKRGFTVLLATESDYDDENLTGVERAEKIRTWLKTVVSEFSYLLLIGDAHADYGDVPMWRVWPRHSYSDDECGGFAIDCRYFETDAIYGSLSGNWDLNGNGQYGEHELDEGEGGMSYTPDLAVGRIPVYFDDTTELDIILQNAIDYMNKTADEITYRKKVLLPASFYYFKGQQMTTYTWPYSLDGAESANWIHHNYFSGDDITVTTMYEEEGHITSEFESSIPLTKDNFVNEWEKGYGMVMWFGHGLAKMVARTIWVEDTNGDNAAQGSEMSQPLLIDSDSVLKASYTAPGFIVAVSCEVGSVETPENLTHSMLLKNAAVGVLSSTNVTPLDETDYSDLESDLDTGKYSENNAGALMYEGLINGQSAAWVYSRARKNLGVDGSIEALAGKLMINYYGDPTLTLYDTVNDIVETDKENDDESSDENEKEDTSSGCSSVMI